MPCLVLLGDSILDNESYTEGGPAVIAQVKEQLPQGWKAVLAAVDGAMTKNVPEQLAVLPPDASHLVLSVGGNDALSRADVLETPVTSSGEALLIMFEVAQTFEIAYREVVASCLACRLPLVVCTIYNGCFPDESFQKRAAVMLAVLNDVIFRVAAEKGLKVIDLRTICHLPEDYANPIEPSSIGGNKIAKAIVRVVTGEV